jgi:DNA-directed RNA polymerase subunit RPC12/RpoP
MDADADEYVCETCGETFPDERTLRDHLYSEGQVY